VGVRDEGDEIWVKLTASCGRPSDRKRPRERPLLGKQL
jgi:hypothetical protein